MYNELSEALAALRDPLAALENLQGMSAGRETF